MRKLLVRSPWPVVPSGSILSAALLLFLSPAFGQQQDSKPQAKDQTGKPAATDRDSKPARYHRLELEGKLKSGEPTLEEMLTKALKDNPDIKVAEAKVREADAELTRVRLQVTQKVLTFHHAREAQKSAVKIAEDDVARVRKLQNSNAVPQQAVTQAEDNLAQAKAKLAEIEAGMPYLLGQETGIDWHIELRLPQTKSKAKDWLDVELPAFVINRSDTVSSVQFSPDGKRVLATGVKPVAETTLEKIRKALDTPVKLDLQAVNAAGVLGDLEKQVPGISFHVMAKTGIADLHLNGQVPLSAALQLIEDTFTGLIEGGASARCSFAIREYGILFTTSDRIPPGAIQLDDLIKEKAFAEKQKAFMEKLKKQSEDKKPTGDKEQKH